MEENGSKDTDKLVLNVISNNLEIDLTEVAIDRMHHIGYPKTKRKKCSSINCQICQVL